MLAVDGVYDATPVNPSVVHKATEHILFAGGELDESAFSIIGCRLHGKEGEQNEQFHHLNEGEPAVRILNCTYHFGL